MSPKQRKMLDDLLSVEEGLSEWEVQFTDDIDKRDREKDGQYVLSLKQERALKKMHDKLFGED